MATLRQPRQQLLPRQLITDRERKTERERDRMKKRERGEEQMKREEAEEEKEQERKSAMGGTKRVRELEREMKKRDGIINAMTIDKGGLEGK